MNKKQSDLLAKIRSRLTLSMAEDDMIQSERDIAEQLVNSGDLIINTGPFTGMGYYNLVPKGEEL